MTSNCRFGNLQCNTLPPLSSWICFNCFGTSKIYSPNDGFSFMVMNPTGSKESVKRSPTKTNPCPLKNHLHPFQGSVKKATQPKEFLELRNRVTSLPQPLAASCCVDQNGPGEAPLFFSLTVSFREMLCFFF